MKPNKFRNILAAILASAFMLSACAPTPTATTDAQVPTSAVTSVPASTATEATTTSESTATIEAAGTTEPALINPSLACGAGQTSATLTPALTEGPYFTSGSPERASLYEEGMAGIKLVITGYVYTADCKPVANALLDFWQADANGVYDNSGYTLRGHQFTDANGYYQLTTVVPGIYPGRTEHIHFKVQAPNGPILTSQLFLPGVEQNDSDGIYDAALSLSIDQQSATEIQASYNFVVTP